VVAENTTNPGGRSDIAKLWFAKLREAAKDSGISSAIPDTLEFCNLDNPQHGIECFLRLRLAIDVTVVLIVVGEKPRRLDKRDATCCAAAIDHIKRARHILRMWTAALIHGCRTSSLR
jgi:hypothetical protein